MGLVLHKFLYAFCILVWPFILRFKTESCHFSRNFSFNILFCKAYLYFTLEWTTLIRKGCWLVDIKVEFKWKEVTNYVYGIISSKNWGRNQWAIELKGALNSHFIWSVIQVYTITCWLMSSIYRYKQGWFGWLDKWYHWTFISCRHHWTFISCRQSLSREDSYVFLFSKDMPFVGMARKNWRKERNSISGTRHKIFLLT